MDSIHKKSGGVTAARGDTGVPSRWLEMALVISVLVLFHQLFPGVWQFVALPALSYLDVRSWTWRSYAVVSALSIITLVALKAWLERDN